MLILYKIIEVVILLILPLSAIVYCWWIIWRCKMRHIKDEQLAEDSEQEDQPCGEYLDKVDAANQSNMKAKNYSINLITGHRGIWLFVTKDGQVAFEQSGIKTIEAALQFAKQAIETEESRVAFKLAENSRWNRKVDNG